MILIIRSGKVIATYTDDKENAIDCHPDCEAIKVKDSIVEFPYGNGMPEDPRLKGLPYIDLKKQGTIEQRLTDIETAIASLLGRL